MSLSSKVTFKLQSLLVARGSGSRQTRVQSQPGSIQTKLTESVPNSTSI